MEDVLEVYQRPYDEKRPMVCMDETSKQLVEENRPSLPPRPGAVQRVDYEYKRNGVANVFLLFEPLAEYRHVQATERRTKIDWAEFMKELVDFHYSDAEKIVLVLDNLNTHRKASLYEAFEPREAKRIADKLELHFTPKHGSWLNMAECEFSVLARQCLNRRIPDKPTLQKEITSWNLDRNHRSKTTDWQFTVEDARIKLKNLYPTIQC